MPRGNVAIFFRKRTPPFEAAVHWVFAQDIDATYDELRSLGAKIVEPLETKPWGLRQFTVETWTETASISTRTDGWAARGLHAGALPERDGPSPARPIRG